MLSIMPTPHTPPTTPWLTFPTPDFQNVPKFLFFLKAFAKKSQATYPFHSTTHVSSLSITVTAFLTQTTSQRSVGLST